MATRLSVVFLLLGANHEIPMVQGALVASEVVDEMEGPGSRQIHGVELVERKPLDQCGSGDVFLVPQNRRDPIMLQRDFEISEERMGDVEVEPDVSDPTRIRDFDGAEYTVWILVRNRDRFILTIGGEGRVCRPIPVALISVRGEAVVPGSAHPEPPVAELVFHGGQNFLPGQVSLVFESPQELGQQCARGSERLRLGRGLDVGDDVYCVPAALAFQGCVHVIFIADAGGRMEQRLTGSQPRHWRLFMWARK